MKRIMMIKFLLGFALSIAGVQAHALLITPGDADWLGSDPKNPNAADVSAITGVGGLLELYKQDVGAATDVGSFASSYETTFSNTLLDPEDAQIRYVGGDSITCPECFLLVKDGNNNPRWYLIDIGTAPLFWDGTDILDIQGFWANTQGGISHVSIFGKSSVVPEPGTLLLLSLGLLGMGLGRKRLA